MKTIAITGSTGFVGTNLRRVFESKGFKVYGIKRDELNNSEKLISIIEEANILINLAGANIIHRWTPKYKKLLESSRLDTTNALIEAISQAENKPEVFISTSAVGIYKNKACYDEESFEYENNFLANLCKSWENIALKAEKLGVRTAIFRFGIVLGEGGALAKMLLPFKLGLGGIIGDGKQYFSFIHIDDLINAYEYVYENKHCRGIYNLTAPTPTNNCDFTKTLGKALNRPTIIPVPEFVFNLIFSQGGEVLTHGQCAKPKRLLDQGFEFKYENITEALNNLIKKK
ncbi:TIGR01777 family oxidoreductase [Poseidonibacter antarcticus]|uniref:TIGR01777 family oxidoreductase n=1 Tax=Poseidonibacter antarcticus TaxID=2478538 RepID=UPI000EF519C0|nr:TIGR01777 family oxidoreductase [Poseidonibacter antarcticus]